MFIFWYDFKWYFLQKALQYDAPHFHLVQERLTHMDKGNERKKLQTNKGTEKQLETEREILINENLWI